LRFIDKIYFSFLIILYNSYLVIINFFRISPKSKPLQISNYGVIFKGYRLIIN